MGRGKKTPHKKTKALTSAEGRHSNKQGAKQRAQNMREPAEVNHDEDKRYQQNDLDNKSIGHSKRKTLAGPVCLH